MIKDEGLDAWEDLGYNDKGVLYVLGQDQGHNKINGSNFHVYLPGLAKVFPDHPLVEISRHEEPERFKKEVDDRLVLLPSAKNYTAMLRRQLNALDATKMGNTLTNKILKKRKNIRFLYNSDVVGYDIDPNTKMAKAVRLGNGTSVPSDLVVVCTGPDCSYHLADCLGIILPTLQAQGYTFDMVYDDLSLHQGYSVLLRESVFTTGQYAPGRHRHSALMDFGCFKKPFHDDERWQGAKTQVARDYGISLKEVDERIRSLYVGRRPMAPDDLEIIGPLKQYPNILLNVGYGPQGFQAFCGSKILESMIE